MRSIFSTCLLFTTAVSVFGQSVELNGIVGKSIEFPAAVKIQGNLRYSGEVAPIGDVTSGRFMPPRDGRLQWHSSTGLFSLSELKMEDSGEYKIQNTDQNINTVFQLNVYNDNVPVSKPHVNITHNKYPCKLMCTVDRGTGATLSWYRVGDKKRYISSDSLDAPYLKLPVPVESGTYTCEAKNSVSNETSDPLTVEAHCTAPGPPATGANTSPSGFSTGTIVLSVLVAVLLVALIAVLIYFLRCRNRREHTSVPTQA